MPLCPSARIVAPALACFGILLAQPSAAQTSLAEIARLEAARRAAITTPSPVITVAGAKPAQSTTSSTTPAAKTATTKGKGTATTGASTTATTSQTLGKVASPRPWGRVAFFATAMQVQPNEGDSIHAEEFSSTFALHSADAKTTRVEFGLDARATKYTAKGRNRRLSIYEGWVGLKLLDDALRVRGGHLWITEIGGLGSVAGGMFEARKTVGNALVRVGAFGGREPVPFDTGYVEGVTRTGGYLAIDASAQRRHTLGYVLVRNQSATERSVLTTMNYLPVTKKVFIYQAAEYDLQGPAGNGKGGLSYFFTNARVTATSRIDLLGSYHRGRSIDARTLTLDQINGRPVPLKSLEGLFFESLSGRVTVEVLKGVRMYVGYGRDRNNRDSDPTGRLQVGGHSGNLAGTGVDVTASFNRIDRGAAGSYDAYYVSAGRSITPRFYLSGDFSSSLSVLRFTRADGVMVETRPETKRYGVSGMLNVGRLVSFIGTAERTDDQNGAEWRVFSGLTYRIQ